MPFNSEAKKYIRSTGISVIKPSLYFLTAEVDQGYGVIKEVGEKSIVWGRVDLKRDESEEYTSIYLKCIHTF